jgi:D-threo-aldose 1-dehydrogenase
VLNAYEVRGRVTITELGFGAAPIGNLSRAIDDATAEAAVDAAWQQGVRYFDTAPHYGLGLSERRLGAALNRYPRQEYAISTKVGRLLVPNPTPTGSDLPHGGFAVPDDLMRKLDYSADGVRRSLEASLRRLNTDHVDIVYVHDPDDPADLERTIREGIPALIRLRDEGVVQAVGAGMNHAAPLRRIVAECDVDMVMLAGRYTLIDRGGAQLLDECASRDVAVAAAAPFNSGLLARAEPCNTAQFDYRPASAELVECARRLADMCTQHGTVLPHAALRFPMTHPAVRTVVVGLRTERQVRDAANWCREPLPAALAAALAGAG